MNHHFVEWAIEPENIRAHFICIATHGAACRMWCAEGCEERCHGTDEEPHRQEDQGGCGQIPFLSESGEPNSASCYSGPETTVRSGPIVLTWEGDDYAWRYVE